MPWYYVVSKLKSVAGPKVQITLLTAFSFRSYTTFTSAGQSLGMVHCDMSAFSGFAETAPTLSTNKTKTFMLTILTGRLVVENCLRIGQTSAAFKLLILMGHSAFDKA
jgi:hypothetical protein